jgi:hypothetical protein
MFFGQTKLQRFKRIDTLLGDLTYPVYTLHFPLNQVFGPPTVFVQLGITIAAAYVVLRFVDAPLSRLRNHVRESDDDTFRPGRAPCWIYRLCRALRSYSLLQVAAAQSTPNPSKRVMPVSISRDVWRDRNSRLNNNNCIFFLSPTAFALRVPLTVGLLLLTVGA